MRAFVLALSLVLSSCSAPPSEPIAQPVEPAYIERGAHLVNGLAACGYCHGSAPSPGDPLVGGRTQYDRYGAVFARNLTPADTGLAHWTAMDIVTALRRGIGPDGARLSQEVHRGYEWLSEEDALSIVAYVMALEPVENEISRRRVGFAERNTVGFFEQAPDVRGYVPSISPRFQLAYGRYLVDTVARCPSCHNSPPAFFGRERYLAGGKEARDDLGEVRVAPGLTSDPEAQLGEWSEGDIISYLRSGKNKQGRTIDPAFCPTNFFRNSTDVEQAAIAAYLKTVPAS